MAPRDIEDLQHRVKEMEDLNLIRDSQIKSLYQVLTGDDPIRGKQPGMAERMAKLEKIVNFIRVMLIGIAIGLLLGALIFGILNLKQLTDALKTFK